MRTVWVANESGHDYEAAEQYGSLKRLTLGNQTPFRLDRLLAHITRGICRFTDEDDYLLISGSPVINSLAFHVWLQTHPRCNLLQWRAKSRENILTKVTRNQVERLVDKALQGGEGTTSH